MATHLGALRPGHSLREAMVWIEHSRLGRISIGHGSNAANNSILVDLSGKGMAASNGVFLHSAAFQIGQANGAVIPNATWGNFFQGTGDWLNDPQRAHPVPHPDACRLLARCLGR